MFTRRYGREELANSAAPMPWALVALGCLALAAVSHAQQTIHTFDGYAPDDTLGTSVSKAGDVNGDGYDDVIVGAPGANGEAGRARVFSGLDGVILHTFYGAAGDRLGHSVAGAGDVNGDTHPDLIVGAPGVNSGRGRAQVFSGLNGTLIHDLDGGILMNLDGFGHSVSGAGDVNNDGRADLIVGTPFRNATTIAWDSGRAQVFSGLDGAVLYTFDGTTQNQTLGRSVSGAGDVNGDTYDDFIIGPTSKTTTAPTPALPECSRVSMEMSSTRFTAPTAASASAIPSAEPATSTVTASTTSS